MSTEPAKTKVECTVEDCGDTYIRRVPDQEMGFTGPLLLEDDPDVILQELLDYGYEEDRAREAIAALGPVGSEAVYV